MEFNDLTLMMIKRGENLFTTKVEKAMDSASDVVKLKLALLLNEFKNKVIIGEIKDCDKLAAARLANACIEIAKNEILTDIEDLKKDALIKYFETPIGHESIKSKTEGQIKLNTELSQEIDSHRPTLSSGQDEQEGREFDCEIIDLVNSIGVEDLTIEGKRARGLLPADFDASVDNETDFEIDLNAKPCANIEIDQYGTVIGITCPNGQCGSSNLVIEMSTGYCLDCDTEFDIPLGIGDRLDDSVGDDFDEEYKDEEIIIWENAEKFKRIEGQKRNRGIYGND